MRTVVVAIEAEKMRWKLSETEVVEQSVIDEVSSLQVVCGFYAGMVHSDG